MIALLIHFLGFLLINSAVPSYIESAGSYFLAGWYAAFAAVDMIALCFAAPRLRILLALSFAWSAALAFECLMLQDTLQRNDWIAQAAIDSILFAYLILLLFRLKTKPQTERQRP
jgi:hypothetical protein